MNIPVDMDKSSAQDTLIKTNEVLLKEREKWLHFASPHLVVTVQKLEDVLPALHEIEQLIKVNEWHAAGFVSYEAASAFDDSLHIRAGPPIESGVEAGSAEFPFLWFGLYSSPGVMSLSKPEKPKEILNGEPSIDRKAYNAAIEKIRNYIADGRTYQVN